MPLVFTSVNVDLSLKDFDGGLIGQGVVQALSAQTGASKVTWTVVPASQFPGGVHEVGAAVLEEHTWVAIISCVAPLLPFEQFLTFKQSTQILRRG